MDFIPTSFQPRGRGNQFRGGNVPIYSARGRGRSNYNSNFPHAEAEGDFSFDPVAERNFNHVKTSPKGVISRANNLYSWIQDLIAKREINQGGSFIAASSGYRNFHILLTEEQKIILFDLQHAHTLISNSQIGPEFTPMYHPLIIHPSVLSNPCISPLEEDLTPHLLHFPVLWLKPQVIERSSFKDCFCLADYMGSLALPHIVSPICMRTAFVNPGDWAVDCKPPVQHYASLTRMYENKIQMEDRERHYRPIVPQPLPLILRWKTLPLTPSWHGRQLKKRDHFYYGLSDSRYRIETTQYYSTEPRHWSPEFHPLHGESEEDSELHCHSLPLYGNESLSRCHFAVLGTAHSFWVSTSNLSDTLVAEEIDMKGNPFTFESFLLSQRKDFLHGAPGAKINCPTCPPSFLPSGKVLIKRYARPEYVNHYRQSHQGDCAFLGLGTGTGLNQRLYEGHALYLMALTMEAMDLLSELEITDFNTDRVKPYTRASEACGLQDQGSLEDQISMMMNPKRNQTPPSSWEGPSSTLQSLSFPRPLSPLSEAVNLNILSIGPEENPPSIEEELEKMEQEGPDPLLLKDTPESNSAPGLEAAQGLQRRETSRHKRDKLQN
jgi:hypothetical protein